MQTNTLAREGHLHVQVNQDSFFTTRSYSLLHFLQYPDPDFVLFHSTGETEGFVALSAGADRFSWMKKTAQTKTTVHFPLSNINRPLLPTLLLLHLPLLATTVKEKTDRVVVSSAETSRKHELVYFSGFTVLPFSNFVMVSELLIYIFCRFASKEAPMLEEFCLVVDDD